MTQRAAGHAKVLRVGVLTPAHDLSPDTQDFVSAMIRWQIFERPYALPVPQSDQPGEPMLFDGPLVPESSALDDLVYSAAVRSGILFSDGTPLEPVHVVEALSRSRTLTDQAEVSLRGDRVVFHLRRPNPRFDLVLAQSFCGIALERDGRWLGTGPFLLARDSAPDRMHLRRNPHYRRPVALDELVFQVYPPEMDHRPEKLIQAIEAGQVDFTSVLSREDVSRLQSVAKSFHPGHSTAILFFNTERPFFSQPSVRRAVAQAIDRHEIAKLSYSNALAFSADGLLPPALDASRNQGIRFNRERAQQELRGTGVTMPGSLRLLLVWAPRLYLPHPRPVAELIAKQLEPLGLRVKILQSRTPMDYFDGMVRGSYDMALGGWIADTPDPADFLEACLASTSVPEPDKSMAIRANASRYRSPAMDQALKRHREQPTRAHLAEVLRLVREEAPLLPLVYGPTIFVHSRRVARFEPSVIGFPDFARMDVT